MRTEGTITPAAAIAAKNLLGVALRAAVKHGNDDEGNEPDVELIESVIAALGECDRIVIEEAE